MISVSGEKRHGVVGPGLVLVFLTAVISGTSTFVNFWAVQGTNSDAFIAVRNGLVALLLVPAVLLARRDVRARLRRVDWIRLGTIGLVGGAIPFLLFFEGLQMAGKAGAATAQFGYRTLFLMAAVLGVVFLRERLSWKATLGAGIVLAGNVALLSLTSPIWTDGTVLVLLATALWAGEYALSKRALRDLPSSTVALGRMGFGGLFLAGWLLLSGQAGAVLGFSGVQWQWVVLSAILLLGFVSTWYAGLKHTDLSTATSVLVLGFPITWVLGVLAGQRAFAVDQAAGVVAIAFGVSLAVGVASLRDSWSYVVRLVRAKLRSAA